VANPPDYGFTSSQDPGSQQPVTSQGNGLAVAGLVLGIIAIPASILTLLDIPIGVLGIIFGGVGIAKANKIGGKGKGMAVAGLICGAIGLILAIALFLIAMGEMKKEMRRSGFSGQIELPVERDPGVHAIG
jgi:hypothetical protein